MGNKVSRGDGAGLRKLQHRGASYGFVIRGDDQRLRLALEDACAGLGDKDREVLEAILSGAPLDAALRKRKERMIVKLRRLFLGGAT